MLIFDLVKCDNIPIRPTIGYSTTTVCVEQCPRTNFLFTMRLCTGRIDKTATEGATYFEERFEQMRENIICRSDVDKTQIHSCADIEMLVIAEKCTKWYLDSKPSRFHEVFDRFLEKLVVNIVFSMCSIVALHSE